MNRPYVYRGRKVPGIYQRCTSTCSPDKCDQHRWSYEIELPTDTGRTRDVKGGFATAKEAQEARAEVLREFNTGNRSLDPKMTLGEWLPKWLDARIERGELRDGTAADYRDSMTRYLIPRLGHHKLGEVRAAHITAAYDAMRRDRLAAIRQAEEINVQRRAEAEAKNKVKHPGHPRVPHLVKVPRPLGPLTMRRIHNTLSGALKSAVKAGLMASNPAPDAELPKAVQPKVKIWTAEQLGAFLDATEKERLYPLYHLAAFAGMRRGELCGISWDDVDLDKSRITVRWQITDQNYRNAKAAEKQGKPAVTGRSRRPEQVRTASSTSTPSRPKFSGRGARTGPEREEWGPAYQDPRDENGTPYNLVFTREDGAPLDPGRTTLGSSGWCARPGCPTSSCTGCATSTSRSSSKPASPSRSSRCGSVTRPRR